MTQDRLTNEYFSWMCDLVKANERGSYQKLLWFLHMHTFRYDIPLDQNRAEDGIDLRYRFANQRRYSHSSILNAIDQRPCSVLEMMVALANRCEETIMTNPELGDRTGEWFWEMIESLGLSRMSDSRFNEEVAYDILERFLEHAYERDGRGGLFTVKHPTHDMRRAEIWSQMWFYLSEQ